MCWGAGSNGKSTLLNLVRSISGDYGHALSFEALRDTKQPQHSTEIAGLAGRRFVPVVEWQEGVRFNEAKVKALTGEDAQRARRLYQDSTEFVPVLKLWVGLNKKPPVGDTTRGFWRRVLLVPFDRTFATDPTLKAQLLAEREGVLAWLVRGAVEYYREGSLCAPDAVLAATNDYRAEQDQLHEFIREELDERADGFISNADLKAAYTDYAVERWPGEQAGVEGSPVLSHRELLKRFRERFRVKRVGPRGAQVEGFAGVRRRVVVPEQEAA